MFSREDTRAVRTEFWTAFGIYMRQHHSVTGRKVKWTNYKTGIRQMYFRLDADAGSARVSIDMEHGDPGLRELFFEQWEELKMLLHGMSGREWVWLPSHSLPHGATISRITTAETGLNIFRQDDWADMFEFLAGIMVALDELWAEARETFEELEG